MLLLWRQDEGRRCCYRHLPTGPSRRTAGAAAARAAAPIEAANRVVRHSVDHAVNILQQLTFRAPIKTFRKPWALRGRAPSGSNPYNVGPISFIYHVVPRCANVSHY